ncbi:MAG TPA: hypothetical protein VLX32_12040 [Candidatus Acidoferrum sp.]|nr:hypothetical protein [Candidatus Acidoferrum sp.]
MPRTRTTKKLAQRIDLNYFKRPTPFKRAKFWLSVLAPGVALLWIASHFISHDPRVYSSGRLSEPHAVFEKQCAACHVQKAGAFSASFSDTACLSCHDGPAHHPDVQPRLACAECHVEHGGRVNLVAASNQACASCHSDLQSPANPAHFAAHIRTFEDGHPEFAALRSVSGVAATDPGTIKLNHGIHMKPIRVGPNGPVVQLDCSDCHRASAAKASWTYADAEYVPAKPSYTDKEVLLLVTSSGNSPPRPATGRELMAPPRFATACARCHLLTFDKRFDEGVPHDKPEVIHAFLVKKFAAYIAAHPSEVRVARDPSRDLTGKPFPPEVRVLTPAQWIAERTAASEDLLWRKTCKQCHTLSFAGGENGLPEIAPARITVKWLPHSNFDHDAHRGFACASCHQKSLTSTESSDILIPGIAVCQTCHAPGPAHAESRCFECHTYHDWSKRREIRPSFTLPALRSSAD